VGFGILLLLPFWWLAPSSAVTEHNFPLILYAAIPASSGAPFCWMNGIKRVGPARASLFMNLLPSSWRSRHSCCWGKNYMSITRRADCSY